jgi:hypothetical protein
MASACDSRGNFDVVAVKWEVPAAGVDVRGSLIQEVRRRSPAFKDLSPRLCVYFENRRYFHGSLVWVSNLSSMLEASRSIRCPLRLLVKSLQVFLFTSHHAFFLSERVRPAP